MIFSALKGETYTSQCFISKLQCFIFKTWCKNSKTLVQELSFLGARDTKV